VEENKNLRLEVEMTMFEDNGDQPFFVGDTTGKWGRMVNRVTGLIKHKMMDYKKEILRKANRLAVEYYTDTVKIRDFDAEIAIKKALEEILKE